MPLKSAPFYYVECDNCGTRADYDEFAAYADPGVAADETIALDWTNAGDVWHCETCPPLDEESG